MELGLRELFAEGSGPKRPVCIGGSQNMGAELAVFEQMRGMVRKLRSTRNRVSELTPSAGKHFLAKFCPSIFPRGEDVLILLSEMRNATAYTLSQLNYSLLEL
jgi:hypothetical protein